MSWWALFAWLMAGACAVVSWRKRQSVERLCPADSESLIAELSGECGKPEHLDDEAKRLAIAELNLRLADVVFELAILPATFVALTRICLASGVGLALISALSRPDGSPIERALRVAAVASGGLFGALVAAGFGRVAKTRSTQIRDEWDSSSRVIGKALGTTLAAVSRKHANSFPE